MKMFVLKEKDSDKPDSVEMDTEFKVGDTLTVEYDYDKNKKDRSTFTVAGIFCNMLVFPHEVMLTLKCEDNLFIERCRCTTFDVFENLLKQRIH